ncbi:hypothetical protein M107_3307 [Bacteroides fragilis str. 3725 D9(v)]|nr:hypothetical protein M077_3387 [Bacteroides fragilis str. 2-F-2 \
MVICLLTFSSANIKDWHKAKKYPGRTARICDKQHLTCDELHPFVINS